MRGRIIHYHGADGHGLISADGKQFSFGIADWRGAIAPALNALVEFEPEGDRAATIYLVSDEAQLREKAGELAGKLGAMGNFAIAHGSKHAAALTEAAPWKRIETPVLIAHLAFCFGALFFTFVGTRFGQSYTLAGLSKLFEQMGASAGGGLLVWLAILSILLPMLWRHRLAACALFLPLLATVKPMWDFRRAFGAAFGAGGDRLPAAMSRAMNEQISQMLSIGLGAWICVLAALVLAAFALRRLVSKAAT
jgi:hypothetical protein